MEPDSLTFLTLVNKVYSHSGAEGGGGGLRAVLGVFVFKTPCSMCNTCGIVDREVKNFSSLSE